MNIVELMIRQNPNIKVAGIDKDEPGGICLTRGCIQSKILLYPAELVRTVESAARFGIDARAPLIGPHASVLIQEIVNLMYTPEQSAGPILYGMNIHPH